MVIAAGNGLGTGGGQPAETYVGMAPEASLVVVKFLTEPGAGSCALCDAGDALIYVDNVAAAAGMPWSVNFSFGNQFWDHEGGDPVELAVDAIVGPGVSGKVITKSAGNDRDSGIHLDAVAFPGVTNVHTFTIPAYTPLAGIFNDLHLFNFWYQPGNTVTLRVTGPTGGTFAASTGDGFGGVGTADGVIIIDDCGSPGPGGTQLLTVELDDQLGVAPRPGIWTFRVTGNTIVDGAYHNWAWLSRFGISQIPGVWTAPDHSHTISSPGTAFNITTVGGYMSRTSWPNSLGGTTSYTSPPPLGQIADFSSRGPTADGRLKPDIAAPGMGIVSTLSDSLSPSVDPLRKSNDLVHWAIEGTSMSSPHVTGTYARVLGLRPCLDATQLRDYLGLAGRTDSFTGAVPNTTWGNGKLDVADLLARVAKHIEDLEARSNHFEFQFTDLGGGIATSYNVYRGDIATLSSGGTGSMLTTAAVAGGLGTFQDMTVPPPGMGNLYVVEGERIGIQGVRSFGFTCMPDIPSCDGFNAGRLTPWDTGC